MKKEGAGASARGDFKVKEFECEFFYFCLGLFKVAPQPVYERLEFGTTRTCVLSFLTQLYARARVLHQPRKDTSQPRLVAS